MKEPKLSKAQQNKLAKESWSIFYKNYYPNLNPLKKDVAYHLTSYWCKNNGISDTQFDKRYGKIKRKYKNNVITVELIKAEFNAQQTTILAIQEELAMKYNW